MAHPSSAAVRRSRSPRVTGGSNTTHVETRNGGRPVCTATQMMRQRQLVPIQNGTPFACTARSADAADLGRLPSRRGSKARQRATRAVHAPRPEHDPRCPVHVTLRCNPGVPSLRSTRLFPRVRAAIGASGRPGFRAVHFSVQADHVHLIVEADGALSLTSGIQGLAIRCALAVNRCLGRRGKVWSVSATTPAPSARRAKSGAASSTCC